VTPVTESPGLRPWLAWGLGSSLFCYGFVLRVSPSVMVSDLMRDFAVGAAILGNLSAFYFYSYAGLQIPVGVLMDRLGPRRLMTAATLLCAGGSLLFAASEALGVAYLGRLMIGAGAAFGWVGTLTILTQWFPPRRFAGLVGGAQMIGMIGAVFGQAPLGLIVGAMGWRGSLMVMAALGGALALALWLVVRDRPHVATAAGPMRLTAGLALVMRNRETWLNAVYGLAMTGTMLSFGGLWAVPYLRTVYALDRADAAAVASLLFVGWGIAAPLIGWSSDRLGHRRPMMIVAGALTTLSLAAVIYWPGLPLLGAAVLIAFNGAAASTMTLCFACAREHNVPAASGAAYGLVNTFVVGSGALLQPLIGWLLDLRWDGTMVDGARVYAPEAFRWALTVLPAASTLGLVSALLSKESHGRQRLE
jgi:MFS family permease